MIYNFVRLAVLPGMMLFSPATRAQINAILPSSSQCPGSLTVPIQVTSFDSVASISLIINFDTAVLAYTGHSNLHPSLAGSGMFVINPTGQRINIAWFSLNPANIGNGTLLDLNFEYMVNKSSQLIWDDDSVGHCDFSDLTGNPLDAVFTDANLTTLFLTPALLEPADQSMFVNDTLIFHWTESQCSPWYQLQYSTDQNFTSNVVSVYNIQNTQVQLSGFLVATMYYWRVRGIMSSSSFPSEWSPVFSFFTKDPDGIESPKPLGQGRLQAIPNPSKGKVQVLFELVSPGSIELRICDLNGQILVLEKRSFLPAGAHSLSVPLENLADGLYIAELYERTREFTHTQRIKILTGP